MIPYMVSSYGNPHSKTHLYGWEAEEAVERARSQVIVLTNYIGIVDILALPSMLSSSTFFQVAKLIGAGSREVIFTSGATESNNIAIKGVASFYRETGKNHLITVQTVRSCVYLNYCLDSI